MRLETPVLHLLPTSWVQALRAPTLAQQSLCEPMTHGHMVSPDLFDGVRCDVPSADGGPTAATTTAPVAKLATTEEGISGSRRGTRNLQVHSVSVASAERETAPAGCCCPRLVPSCKHALDNLCGRESSGRCSCRSATPGWLALGATKLVAFRAAHAKQREPAKQSTSAPRRQRSGRQDGTSGAPMSEAPAFQGR